MQNPLGSGLAGWLQGGVQRLFERVRNNKDTTEQRLFSPFMRPARRPLARIDPAVRQGRALQVVSQETIFATYRSATLRLPALLFPVFPFRIFSHSIPIPGYPGFERAYVKL